MLKQSQTRMPRKCGRRNGDRQRFKCDTSCFAAIAHFLNTSHTEDEFQFNVAPLFFFTPPNMQSVYRGSCGNHIHETVKKHTVYIILQGFMAARLSICHIKAKSVFNCFKSPSSKHFVGAQQ